MKTDRGCKVLEEGDVICYNLGGRDHYMVLITDATLRLRNHKNKKGESEGLKPVIVGKVIKEYNGGGGHPLHTTITFNVEGLGRAIEENRIKIIDKLTAVMNGAIIELKEQQ